MTLLAVQLGPSAYWYLARATGVVALVLLTLSVVLGILGSVRFSAGPHWPRFAIDSLHRDTSLLVVALIIIHVVTSVLDGFAPISLLDGVIPFHSAYRSLWLGLGAVSFDLILALVVTSLVRRRLGYQGWRAVHWLAYVSWPVAVLHGLGSGTDVKAGWSVALTLACLAAVLVAVAIRLRGAEDSGVRAGATVLAIAAPIGLAVFAVQGPFQKDWSRRAGTPTHLLGSVHPVSRTVSKPAVAAPAATSPLMRAFTANLSGSVAQSTAPGGAVVELGLRLSGGASGQLRVRMGGAPLSGGGLSLAGSQVDLTGPGLPAALAGKIVSLQGDQLVARVSSYTGAQMQLQASLSVDQNSGQVTGTLRGTPDGSR
ncbi:MAG: ferric reductase-like transmembrane domain-containing protein [Solirubrobacterales bacterium]|nr:ferric reductase-like transmembrane domain-containing protein [Solirubrobacterales bacterium]